MYEDFTYIKYNGRKLDTMWQMHKDFIFGGLFTPSILIASIRKKLYKIVNQFLIILLESEQQRNNA